MSDETDAFVIEDGIPVPPARSFMSKYPVARLKPGQSFFVPVSKAKSTGLRNSISHAARNAQPRVFTRIAIDKKDGVDGIRVWRIADRHPTPRKAGR